MNSARPLLRWLLFGLAACVSNVFAQNPPASGIPGTATIAGRVSVEGGVLAGILLMLQRDSGTFEILNQKPPLTTVTDADGNYRFSNVPAGKYRLQVYAPVYVKEQKDESFRSGQPVNVAEGEAIENLNFSLRRGGVITGKVTDPAGQPLIEEAVKLIRVDAQGKKVNEAAAPPSLVSFNRTDDRGVYRLFGIEPGRYRVAAGAEQNENSLFGLSKEFQQTFHPHVTNEAEARILEIGPGVEVEGVDIVMVPANTKKGFVASGRVIETDTRNPVAGVMIAYSAKGMSDSGMPFGMTPATTNSQGEFRLEGLAAGTYTVSVFNIQGMMGTSSELYSEPLNVDISNSDVSGLELKMTKGTVISGSVVLDGTPDPKLLAKLVGTIVQAIPDGGDNDPSAIMTMMSSMAMGTVNSDRTFRISGVRPGKFTMNATNLKEQALKLLRVEQNGAAVGKVEVTGTNPIADVRLVIAFGSATLVGRVEVRGGALPPGTSFSIFAIQKDAPAADQPSFTESDARGQFSLEGIVPGTYEVSVASIKTPNNAPVKSENAKQTVTLAANARQEIVLIVELNPKEKD